MPSKFLIQFLTGFLLLAKLSRAASPNILIVIADDFGADSCRFYNATNAGASLPPTPNLDALARAGVVFRNAYANPLCSPTRATLLTGRHCFRTGVGDVIAGPNSAALTTNEFTLPEAFSANAPLGYRLAQFGKWHLGGQASAPNTLGGWPHFAGSIQGAIANYTNWNKVINGAAAPSTAYATTDVVNDAQAWILGQTNSPWLAWVAFNAPHAPLHKPPSALCPTYAGLPGTTFDINQRPRLYYEAMVEAMDTELGRLLRNIPLTNTWVFFIGDNGTPGDVIQPPYAANRAKGTIYEGGTKVPMIVAGPGVVRPNRTNDTLTHVVDLHATILELAGIEAAATLPAGRAYDSQSLLPLLHDQAVTPRFAYSELFSDPADSSDGQCLRYGGYKLLRFADRQEFYHLATDPTEATNLLGTVLTAEALDHYFALAMRFGLHQEVLPAPVLSSGNVQNFGYFVSLPVGTNDGYQLWRSAGLGVLGWAPVTNAVIRTNSGRVLLLDTNPPAGNQFYRVKVSD